MWWFGRKGASGFSGSSTAEQVTHGIDATGLTAIVTGASSGIGAETTRVLALRGVHVIMGVRNMNSGREVKDKIVQEIPAAKVDAMELDLSSMASVKKFASDYEASKRPLNLLIHGPSRRCQAHGYARSARHSNGTEGHDLLQETNSSSSSSSSYRSLMSFAIPTALLGAVGVAGYVRYNDERRAIAKGDGTREGTTAKGSTIGGPFTLINTEHEVVTEESLLGNWVLLYFGYTSSPDIGPDEVQKMVKAIDILESKQNVKLLPVFVTIDPQRDSPSHLKAYLREFDSRIVGLTGPDNSIRQMAQEYRVFFRKVEEDGNDYLVDSSHNMYLMNPNMEIVRCFGIEYSAADLAEATVKELKKSAT